MKRVGFCPNEDCGVEGDFIESSPEDQSVWEHWGCPVCGCEWFEVYHYDHYEIETPGGSPHGYSLPSDR